MMNASDAVWRLKARWAFPVEGPPVENAVVTIADERIVDVRSAVRHSNVAGCRDLGDVAILPGLVNAHTHLEFSDLGAPLGRPGQVFPDWIRDVVAWRRSGTPRVIRPVSAGLRESIAAGTTAIGEIATADWSPSDLIESPSNVTVFRELIGLDRARIEANLSAAREHLARHRDSSDKSVWRPGISPHAPYTIHPELLARVVEFSAAERFPLAMHLAESREELELLDSATGPFVALLEELNAWHADAIPRGTRPMDHLHQLARADRALVIHGNYLDEHEVAFLAENAARMSVVYCPRTHAYFGHEPYPLARYLAAGVAMSLGTDSRASNPDLSLWREMQFVATYHPSAPASRVLELVTLGGARALGIADTCGSLGPGKRADLAVVAIDPRVPADPHELLFDERARVVATVLGGKIVAGGDAIDLKPASD